VKLPALPENELMLAGVAKTIEEILTELGKETRLAREGNNRWEVKEGGARIKIAYNPESYFITADAYLCQLPRVADKIKSFYQFLLEENFRTMGLVLSCVNQNVILSCVLYDLDISKSHGQDLLKELFKKAKDYDNRFKTEFECIPRLEE
jgi:serine protease Do